MANVKHSTLSGSALHQPFNSGLDASKPASPSVGDHYYATDTKKLYECQVAAAWVQISPVCVRGTFTNSDLSSGILTVTHSKGLSAPYTLLVRVFNNSSQEVDCPVTGATNSFQIDLSDFGTLSGTWGYIYIA